MEPKTNPIDKVYDNPQYSIKKVSVETGIPTVTLRAWERRYQLLSPHRSENRYRLYSDRDVAVLRWIKSQIDSGLSISSAVTRLQLFIKDGISLEVGTRTPLSGGQQQVNSPQFYADHLFTALVSHHETEADEFLQAAFALYNLTTVFMEVISPCLVKIGDAWVRGEFSIAQEHMASNYIKGKLLTLLLANPNHRSAWAASPTLLVGCAPFEQHEIGTLMLAVLLRREGYRVDYLGQDVPLDDLLGYARAEHPAMVILSATLENNARELVGFQDKLSRLRPAPMFGYGGLVFNQQPALHSHINGIYLGESLKEAVGKVHSLLG